MFFYFETVLASRNKLLLKLTLQGKCKKDAAIFSSIHLDVMFNLEISFAKCAISGLSCNFKLCTAFRLKPNWFHMKRFTVPSGRIFSRSILDQDFVQV